MPINKPTPQSVPVFFPESNYQIAKYLDITKFVSLLSLKSLFFCRLDKLEDHFEGTTSKPNFELRKESYRYLNNLFPNRKQLTEEEIEINVKSQYASDEKFKAVNCVCCWNKFKNESAALWKIYSDLHKGVMIKTNINDLISSFKDTPEELDLSEIKYIDYEKEYMPDHNLTYPIIHKHNAYYFEDEVRIINTVKYGNKFTFDWDSEKVKNGKYISVDITKLINEVVVSPYAENWYFELISDLCSKYGLESITIVKSKLSK